MDPLSSSAQIWATLSVWTEALLAPIAAACCSLIYFRTSPPTQRLSTRLWVSAHGIAISAMYAAAMLVTVTRHSDLRFGAPFASLAALPLALIVISMVWYRGPKRVHLLQLINLLCLMWTLFVGTMAVTGEWL